MSFELLVQLLVLAATAALFWIARRDLASRTAPPAAAPETGELEQLCGTLESLVTDLACRLAALERQIAAVGADLSVGPSTAIGPSAAVGPSDLPAPSGPADEPPDARYAPVYNLLADGVTDPEEIARRTGLNRGEVDLILSLRARRAL